MVDGILKRQLVFPSQLLESQEQPSSHEQDATQPEQASPIEQVQAHSSPSNVLSQEAQPTVSLPDTPTPDHRVQPHIEEPPVHFA